MQDRASRGDDPHEKADPSACAPGMSSEGESGPDEEMRRILAAAAADDDDDDDDRMVWFRLLLNLPMIINQSIVFGRCVVRLDCCRRLWL